MGAVAALLTLEEFTLRTFIPSEDVDLVESKKPSYILSRLTFWSSWIESRLRKRYAVPFATPTPEIVLGWLTDLVNPEVYKARGRNPDDEEQFDEIIQARKDALDALKEAADGEQGLYDLPLRQDNAGSAVTGGPLGYSEPSPFDWLDVQAEAVRGR